MAQLSIQRISVLEKSKLFESIITVIRGSILPSHSPSLNCMPLDVSCSVDLSEAVCLQQQNLRHNLGYLIL